MTPRTRVLVVLAVLVVGGANLAAGGVNAATPPAKLGLIATGGPQAVQPGSSISYTFTILVHGANAQQVTLVDVLPATVTPVSVASTDGSCVLGQVVRCSLGTIAVNGTANVAIVARAVGAGPATNTGSVTAANQAAGQPPAHASVAVVVAPAIPPSPAVIPPSVSSGGLGQIDQHTAVVQAILGAASGPTTYWVQYGTTNDYGRSTPVRLLRGAGGSMLELLGGLKPGVVYHFRAVARNLAGETLGRDESFETLGRRRPGLDASLSVQGSPDASAVMMATLQVPRGVTVHDACRGNVTFALDSNMRTLARRQVDLNASCVANAKISLPSKATGLRVRVAFAGNSSVTSRSVVSDAH